MSVYISKHKSLFILAVSLLLLVTLIVLLSVKTNHDQATENIYEHLGGDFVLQSSEGPVSLSDYRGKLVVLYFGYAFCPDVCPTSLGLLSLALNKLSQRELENIQALFISVDPGRDTVDKLKKYAEAFHPAIKGITGTNAQVADVAKRYGAAYMKVETPGSALGYTVDHSSRYYVIGPGGKLQQLIEHGSSPEKIVATLRELL